MTTNLTKEVLKGIKETPKKIWNSRVLNKPWKRIASGIALGVGAFSGGWLNWNYDMAIQHLHLHDDRETGVPSSRNCLTQEIRFDTSDYTLKGPRQTRAYYLEGEPIRVTEVQYTWDEVITAYKRLGSVYGESINSEGVYDKSSLLAKFSQDQTANSIPTQIKIVHGEENVTPERFNQVVKQNSKNKVLSEEIVELKKGCD